MKRSLCILTLAAEAGGETLVETFAEDTTLPLPVFNLGMDVAIIPKLFLKQSLDFFYISLDGFEGLLLDANVALEYNTFHRTLREGSTCGSRVDLSAVQV